MCEALTNMYINYIPLLLFNILSNRIRLVKLQLLTSVKLQWLKTTQVIFWSHPSTCGWGEGVGSSADCCYSAIQADGEVPSWTFQREGELWRVPISKSSQLTKSCLTKPKRGWGMQLYHMSGRTLEGWVENEVDWLGIQNWKKNNKATCLTTKPSSTQQKKITQGLHFLTPNLTTENRPSNLIPLPDEQESHNNIKWA